MTNGCITAGNSNSMIDRDRINNATVTGGTTSNITSVRDNISGCNKTTIGDVNTNMLSASDDLITGVMTDQYGDVTLSNLRNSIRSVTHSGITNDILNQRILCSSALLSPNLTPTLTPTFNINDTLHDSNCNIDDTRVMSTAITTSASSIIDNNFRESDNGNVRISNSNVRISNFNVPFSSYKRQSNAFNDNVRLRQQSDRYNELPRQQSDQYNELPPRHSTLYNGSVNHSTSSQFTVHRSTISAAADMSNAVDRNVTANLSPQHSSVKNDNGNVCSQFCNGNPALAANGNPALAANGNTPPNAGSARAPAMSQGNRFQSGHSSRAPEPHQSEYADTTGVLQATTAVQPTTAVGVYNRPDPLVRKRKKAVLSAPDGNLLDATRNSGAELILTSPSVADRSRLCPRTSPSVADGHQLPSEGGRLYADCQPLEESWSKPSRVNVQTVRAAASARENAQTVYAAASARENAQTVCAAASARENAQTVCAAASAREDSGDKDLSPRDKGAADESFVKLPFVRRSPSNPGLKSSNNSTLGIWVRNGSVSTVDVKSCDVKGVGAKRVINVNDSAVNSVSDVNSSEEDSRNDDNEANNSASCLPTLPPCGGVPGLSAPGSSTALDLGHCVGGGSSVAGPSSVVSDDSSLNDFLDSVRDGATSAPLTNGQCCKLLTGGY